MQTITEHNMDMESVKFSKRSYHQHSKFKKNLNAL